jgi:hypothetical protein
VRYREQSSSVRFKAQYALFEVRLLIHLPSSRRYERLARTYGMHSTHRRSRPKPEYSDLQTKARMKQKLIESEEGSNTQVDDEEGFGDAEFKRVIKTEPENMVAVKTEENDSAKHHAELGWQGDSELMQYYDVPEVIIKVEAEEGRYNKELVCGTSRAGPNHEMCCTSALGQLQHTEFTGLGSSRAQGYCNLDSIKHSMKQENQAIQMPEPVLSFFAEGSHPENPVLLD